MGLPSRNRKLTLVERPAMHLLAVIAVLLAGWLGAPPAHQSGVATWFLLPWYENGSEAGWLKLVCLLFAMAGFLAAVRLVLPREDPLLQASLGCGSGERFDSRLGDRNRWLIAGVGVGLLGLMIGQAAMANGGQLAVGILCLVLGGTALAKRKSGVAAVLLGVATILYPLLTIPVATWVIVRKEVLAAGAVLVPAAMFIGAYDLNPDPVMPLAADWFLSTPLAVLACLVVFYSYYRSQVEKDKVTTWSAYRPSKFPNANEEQPSHGVARDLSLVILIALWLGADTWMGDDAWPLLLPAIVLLRDAVIWRGVRAIMCGLAFVAVVAAIGYSAISAGESYGSVKLTIMVSCGVGVASLAWVTGGLDEERDQDAEVQEASPS